MLTTAISLVKTLIKTSDLSRLTSLKPRSQFTTRLTIKISIIIVIILETLLNPS